MGQFLKRLYRSIEMANSTGSNAVWLIIGPTVLSIWASFQAQAVHWPLFWVLTVGLIVLTYSMIFLLIIVHFRKIFFGQKPYCQIYLGFEQQDRLVHTAADEVVAELEGNLLKRGLQITAVEGVENTFYFLFDRPFFDDTYKLKFVEIVGVAKIGIEYISKGSQDCRIKFSLPGHLQQAVANVVFTYED